MRRHGALPGLVLVIVGLLAGLILLSGLLINSAFGEPAAHDAVERAAADPATSVQFCTCVEGPLAAEIEKLRTQVRLLKAEARVNQGMQCAAARRGKKQP